MQQPRRPSALGRQYCHHAASTKHFADSTDSGASSCCTTASTERVAACSSDRATNYRLPMQPRCRAWVTRRVVKRRLSSARDNADLRAGGQQSLDHFVVPRADRRVQRRPTLQAPSTLSMQIIKGWQASCTWGSHCFLIPSRDSRVMTRVLGPHKRCGSRGRPTQCCTAVVLDWHEAQHCIAHLVVLTVHGRRGSALQQKVYLAPHSVQSALLSQAFLAT